MANIRGRISIAALCVAAIVMYPGCGERKKIDEAEQTIKALEAKGVPDTVLTGPKVLLFQVRGAMASGQSGIMRKNRDSLFISVANAQQWYETTMQRLKPEVDALMKSLNERKKELTGMQLRTADSLIAIADSFAAIQWLIQSKQKAEIINAMMPSLLNDEALMQKLRPNIIGTWVGEARPDDNRLKAVEKRKYSFSSDGKLYIEEEMKGQTQEYLKEDWKFVSWGRWDMKGDTALLYIDREKCERQTYWTLKNNAWQKEDKATYDSTITDRRKDRFMAWDYFQQFLKKVK